MMTERQDALVAASQLVLAVREEATRIDGRQVGTVGRLDVHPNAANVIPGKVELSIELRDLSEAKLKTIAEAIAARAKAIATATKTAIEIAPTGHYGPALVMSRKWKAALAPWLAGVPIRTGFAGEFRFGLLNDVRFGERKLPRMIDQMAALALPKAAIPARRRSRRAAIGRTPSRRWQSNSSTCTAGARTGRGRWRARSSYSICTSFRAGEKD